MQGLITIEILRVSHLYQPTYTRLREHWRKMGRKNARFRGWKRELQYSLGYGMTGTLKLFFFVMISTRPARDQVNKKNSSMCQGMSTKAPPLSEELLAVDSSQRRQDHFSLPKISQFGFCCPDKYQKQKQFWRRGCISSYRLQPFIQKS